MSFVKRLWKDRVSQYPNRRAIYDGSFSKSVTVSRDEGNITEPGDPFNAENMNDLEDRIEAGLAEKPDREEVEEMVEGFFPLDEASGAFASFNPGVMLPLRSCECQINAKQAGTGDPAPDNIRAISGYTACSVSVVGKNLLEIEATSGIVGTITFTVNADKSITVNGSTTTQRVFRVHTDFSFNDDLIISGIPSGSGLMLNVAGLGSDTGSGFAFNGVTPRNIQIVVPANTSVNNVTIYPMVRLASDTNPNYEQYKGNTYVVDFGGINQWDEEWELGTLKWDDGSPQDSSDHIRAKNYTSVMPNTTYYIVGKVILYEYDESYNVLARYNVSSNQAITTTSTTKYIKIRSSESITQYENNWSINYPSFVTDYHPYNPNGAGIVYGGRINVTTGELIVTWLGHVFDGSESFGTTGSGQSLYYFYTLPYLVSSNTSEAIQKMSHYKFSIVNSSTQTINAGYVYNSGGTSPRWAVRPDLSSYPDSTSYKAYLAAQYAANTPVTLAYELNTPLVYNLDPVVIKTLFKQNNIYHDCNGDIDVIFHKALTAKNIFFDNSGTTLTATNVEDAIKEVLGRI